MEPDARLGNGSFHSGLSTMPVDVAIDERAHSLAPSILKLHQRLPADTASGLRKLTRLQCEETSASATHVHHGPEGPQ
jgi:hypothetical protein